MIQDDITEALLFQSCPSRSFKLVIGEVLRLVARFRVSVASFITVIPWRR